MQAFSGLEHSINQLEEQRRTQMMSAAASPWSERERRPGRRERRVADSMADFWVFDSTYFPPEVHSAYAKPCRMHHDLLDAFLGIGTDLVLAPRDHAKTVYAKKILLWMLLSGRHYITGIVCETVPKAANWLQDVVDQLTLNPRIASDFDIKITKDANDQLEFFVQPSTPAVGDGKMRLAAVFGEGRSVKGFSRAMQRPTLLVLDDIETMQSSLTDDAVKLRGRQLSENVSSLQNDTGSAVILGNNFDERCALNVLKKEAEEGILPEKWRVHVYKAWDGRPLWRERYPAQSESEFKVMVGVRSEAEFQSNYQQNPVPDEGYIFLPDFYTEYDYLPEDLQGVMYVDPNLSKKRKGDTTAATAIAWSPGEGAFYVLGCVVESFSGSNELLKRTNALYRAHRKHVAVFGMDGSVSQESTWSNNVRNFEMISGIPFPRIVYCAYNVDNLAKNAQLYWCERRIRFPRGFALTKEGKEYTQQVHAFVGKKHNKRDDAPDSLICAIELMHERKFIRRASNAPRFSIIEPSRL
jgi:hypothetical protein